ncbi:6-pyruvoyl trahydropterin synthase family protein [Rhodothermus profundi]|uniref:6-carboxy-5,6,7,8-tetrahydropterin synthase n=1 Tax=Rhodothermus profundi TaxID=633813 RepID=A0A1M6VW74_9BACT|nr:6-carboxytetrahydropterin synthase [Rhodothermus profundi]SHK85691.1 6-pyruvoyltetrahydropterin/6-carboxytetrahydropterin synthase [Rhodothermus profundi]
MKIAKQFRFEAAHRLPWHPGACRHLHGHSYRLTVGLEGTPDARGILVDFQDLKRLLNPLIESWDHATLVASDDTALQEALDVLGSRYVVLPFDSTAENLCTYVADYLIREAGEWLRARGVRRLWVRLAETETSFAETECALVSDVRPQPATHAETH